MHDAQEQDHVILHTEVLRSVPSNSYARPRLLKAIWPKPLRKYSSTVLPNKKFSVNNVRFNTKNFQQFKRVCGFSPTQNAVPICYPHIMAFGLHLHFFSEQDFPFNMLGLIHTDNCIQRFNATPLDENYTLSVFLDNLRPHPKGANFDLVSEYDIAGETVWRERCTLLAQLPAKMRDAPDHRNIKNERPAMPKKPCSEKADVWHMPSNTGRAYGSVSSDRNPIHLYPLTAKLFGFKRHIAHGMWTLARSNAAIESELVNHSWPSSRLELSNQFHRPVFLPSTVHHYTTFNKQSATMEVWDSKATTLHMTGQASVI